jgi:hypothetical protein
MYYAGLYCLMYSGYEQGNSTHVKENIGQGIFLIFYLRNCWLVASKRPEGPATSHLDIDFFGFSLSSSKCWDPKFQVFAACFSCSPSRFLIQN